jgi:hypothetical protein
VSTANPLGAEGPRGPEGAFGPQETRAKRGPAGPSDCPKAGLHAYGHSFRNNGYFQEKISAREPPRNSGHATLKKIGPRSGLDCPGQIEHSSPNTARRRRTFFWGCTYVRSVWCAEGAKPDPLGAGGPQGPCGALQPPERSEETALALEQPTLTLSKSFSTQTNVWFTLAKLLDWVERNLDDPFQTSDHPNQFGVHPRPDPKVRGTPRVCSLHENTPIRVWALQMVYTRPL